MADNVTSNFATVGEAGYHQVVNLSGDRSPYTIAVPRDKGGARQSAVPGEGAGAPSRSASMIREANGPRPNTIPLATRWPANAACALEIQRNVVPVASALGNRDFWAKRAEGPVI
jgi:hypothetical protein